MSNASAVEAVLFAALEKPTAAERTAFLDSACAGDAELRRQVEKLLKAHANVGNFLQKPVVALPAAAPEPADDTQALDAATDGPDARPPGGTGLYLARTEGGGAIDEENPLAFLQLTTRPDSLGRLGHYEVLEVLGRGGFGIVFRAFDVQLQRVVAIKVLAPEMAGTALACKRFLREARSSARVRHENVVQIYTVEEEPLPYLVMEFVPGETLQQRLDRTGHMEMTEVIQLGRQIAEGLAAAHGTGLIHRDIKPGNILIEAGPNQHVKITDFGLARTAEDASITRSGVISGTPMFMAPEQASAGTLDHRADLFSLGSVLYLMCSGRPPFRAPGTLAVLKRVIEDTPRPIREIIPEVPQWLCDLIARLHAKKPDDRIATAREVADLLGYGLAALQAHGSVKPPSVAAPAPVHKTPPAWKTPEAAPAIKLRSHRRRWLVAAAMFLTLLGGLALTETTGVSDVRGTVIGLFSPEGTPEIRVAKVASREPVTDTKTGRQGVQVSQGGKDTEPAKTPNPKQPAPELPKPKTATLEPKDWLDAVAKEPLPQQIESLNRKMLEVNKLAVKMAFEPKEGPPTKCTITAGIPYLIWPLLALPSLTALDLTQTSVTDFTPLARLPLTELNVNLIVDNVKSEAALKSMATLKTVNGRPAAEYWAERAALRKEIDDMVVKASTLSLNGRQAWFRSVMKKLNPKWTGNAGGGLSKDKTNGLITLLFTLAGSEGPVFDFSPVRALGLEAIHLFGTNQLCDFSPLAKSKLQIFRYVNANGSLRDLSPLAGLPLKELDLTGAWNLIDISPLAGMKLESFQLWHFSNVTDVKVLHDMPITTLALPHLITDLKPFKTMKLTSLGCSATDLGPLAGLPLETLTFRGSRPADLSPLAGMKLKHYTSIEFNGYWLWFRTDYEPDEKMFRAMPLVTINGKPAATFWAAYDADRKALQEFVTATAKLAPADAVAAVNEALKKKGRALDDSRIEDGAVVEVKLSQIQGSKFELNPLGPLKAFPRLKKITIADISPYHWPNLAPLMKLPIEEIVCTPATVAGNTIILRQMPTLKTINGKPAAEVLTR